MRGKYAVIAVRTVLGICREAEAAFDHTEHYEYLISNLVEVLLTNSHHHEQCHACLTTPGGWWHEGSTGQQRPAGEPTRTPLHEQVNVWLGGQPHAAGFTWVPVKPVCRAAGHGCCQDQRCGLDTLLLSCTTVTSLLGICCTADCTLHLKPIFAPPSPFFWCFTDGAKPIPHVFSNHSLASSTSSLPARGASTISLYKLEALASSAVRAVAKVQVCW